MPSAPDELRDLAEKLWGGMDTVGPLEFLKERGYKVMRGGEFIPPVPGHKPTWMEGIALDFLFMEWDFGGIVDEFRKGLEKLINEHSKENGSNTPDFILANFLAASIAAFDAAVRLRSAWRKD